MIGRSEIGFALGASASAGVGGLFLVLWLAAAQPERIGWAIAGFLAMAIPAIAGGSWLVHEHGRPGAGFVVALGVGIGTRLLLASIAAAGASQVGGEVAGALVAGLAAGFVPVALFEMVWFVRRTTPRTTPDEIAR